MLILKEITKNTDLNPFPWKAMIIMLVIWKIKNKFTFYANVERNKILGKKL